MANKKYECTICNIFTSNQTSLDSHLLGSKHQLTLHTKLVREKKEKCGIYVTGIAPNASKTVIWDFFSQFGKIFEYYSDNQNSFVIIQFEKEEIAAEVLKKRLFFLGRYLLIKPRILKKIETRTPETRQIEDYGRIIEHIKQFPDFDNQLNQFIRMLQVHENFLQPPDYVRVCDDLERCLRSKFPNCRVRPFGSTFSGLGFKNSDMDIYVEVVNHLNISSSSDDSPAAIYTKIAKKVLSDTKLFSNVIAIPKAKTPIVKLIHKATGINCDINFKNMLGVCNSVLIKFLLSLDFRLRPLLFIIKFWAKVNEISGTGKIANYGITMFAIFYFQREPFLLLPPIEILQTRENEVFIDGWNGGFHTNRNFIPAYYFKCSVHVTKILEGFFNFWAKFDYGFNVICPLNAKILQKSDFSSPEKLSYSFLLYKNNLNNAGPLKTDSPLCLQDPFELNHNITGNVSVKQLEEFQKLCQIAADICSDCIASNDLQNLLPKLFAKQQLEKVIMVTNEKCVFKIPGTVINVDTTTNSENNQQIWFNKLIEFLTTALSKFFLFEVNVSKDEHRSKSQKLNEQTDIHDDNINDMYSFHCVGYSNVWEARKSIAKNLGSTIIKDSFVEQEVAISEYIANVLCSGIKFKDAIVDFKLVIYFKVNPTEAEFILTDINSRKNSFKILANFFARKIPDWFDRYLKELKNINNTKENEPNEKVIIIE